MSCYHYRGLFHAEFALRVHTETSRKIPASGHSHGSGYVVQAISVTLALSQLLFSPTPAILPPPPPQALQTCRKNNKISCQCEHSLVPRLHSPVFLAPCRKATHGARKAGEWSLGTRLCEQWSVSPACTHRSGLQRWS